MTLLEASAANAPSVPSVPLPIAVPELFAPFEPDSETVLRTDACERSRRQDSRASVIVDRFRGGAACAFVRIAATDTKVVRFALHGSYGIRSCPSGGWLLTSADPELATYWIPRGPMLRRNDPQGRIVFESAASLGALGPHGAETAIDLVLDADSHLDVVIWRFPAEAADPVDELGRVLGLERQPVFMLASHTSLCCPGDVYAYLIHGHVYENRFDPVRKRKICAELEAYSLFLALDGFETATGKMLYRLLKEQLIVSVIDRQASDGGWYHGEWTDGMESHYRFHNAAMLMLEGALEEGENGTVSAALTKAASVLSQCTDRTDLGVWFFHDSLEKSVEATQTSGIRWIPSRELGKSPATKLILNSHVDAIVALDRYRQVTGDERYSKLVASALDATRRLLSLRPAEWLYRPLYWAVGLTLLPAAEAERLSLPLRALKRVARNSIIPQLHRIKRRFPRIVMPGGMIERHVSRLHFGVNYHSVNVMDLARLARRFPSEDLSEVIDRAIDAVTGTSLARYWLESGQRQALGYWVEALYQVCASKPGLEYRRRLADAMLAAVDAGLGLPPSLLGAHPEIVSPAERFRCPSPMDARLRVANLSRADHREVLVVNPTKSAIELVWAEGDGVPWDYVAAAPSKTTPDASSSRLVPARGWLLGRGGMTRADAAERRISAAPPHPFLRA